VLESPGGLIQARFGNKPVLVPNDEAQIAAILDS